MPGTGENCLICMMSSAHWNLRKLLVTYKGTIAPDPRLNFAKSWAQLSLPEVSASHEALNFEVSIFLGDTGFVYCFKTWDLGQKF